VHFSALVTLLNTNLLAKRLDPVENVWEVSSSWWRGQAADRLLADAISALLAAGQPCFLVSGFPVDREDLGAEPWEAVTTTLWRMPGDLDPTSFTQSSAHNEGNYALYVCPSEKNVERIPEGLPWWAGLPWWGWRGPRDRAARINEGLQKAGVEVAVVVHPDASDWIVAVPDARQNVQSRTA
jgi:hypothetical protein